MDQHVLYMFCLLKILVQYKKPKAKWLLNILGLGQALSPSIYESDKLSYLASLDSGKRRAQAYIYT